MNANQVDKKIGHDVVEGREKSSLDSQFKYLRDATRQNFGKVSNEKFFGDRKIVLNLGSEVAMKMRLGYCETAEAWKVYLFKPNPNCKPSVVTVSFLELPQTIAILSGILKKIHDGEESNNPYLKPDNVDENWKPERSDNIKFWEKDLFTTASGRVRVKTLWHFGSHSIFINNPSDPTFAYPKFFGPKVSLTPNEVENFVLNLMEIEGSCPSHGEMLDFISDYEHLD